MSQIKSFFIRGLLTLIPIVLSVYVLYWFFAGAEIWANDFFKLIIPSFPYIPGFGLVFSFFVVVGVGFLMSSYLIRNVYEHIEGYLNQIPVIKSVYGALKDFTAYFSPDNKAVKQQVVVFRVPGTEIEMVGFVTRSDLAEMPSPLNMAEKLAVYVPLSYQIGGWTLFVPKSDVRPLDMGVEKAMRMALTAWMPGGLPNGKNLKP